MKLVDVFCPDCCRKWQDEAPDDAGEGFREYCCPACHVKRRRPRELITSIVSKEYAEAVVARDDETSGPMESFLRNLIPDQLWRQRAERLKKFAGKVADDPDQIIRTLYSTYACSCHAFRHAS